MRRPAPLYGMSGSLQPQPQSAAAAAPGGLGAGLGGGFGSASAARDALFGVSSGGGGGGGGGAGAGGARAERLPGGSAAAQLQQRGFGGGGGGGGAASALEEENDRLTLELGRKVEALRHATQSIHDEVGEHNRMLSGMGADFERAGGLMGGALARLDGLLRGGGTQGHLCQLALFMAGVCVLLWWLVLKR